MDCSYKAEGEKEGNCGVFQKQRGKFVEINKNIPMLLKFRSNGDIMDKEEKYAVSARAESQTE